MRIGCYVFCITEFLYGDAVYFVHSHCMDALCSVLLYEDIVYFVPSPGQGVMWRDRFVPFDWVENLLHADILLELEYWNLDS